MPPKASKTPRKPVVLPEDDDAFIRLPTVLSVFPIGANTWLKGVAEGRFPPSYRLSTRVVAWKVADIRRLLASVSDATA